MKWEYLTYRYTPVGFFAGVVKVDELNVDLNRFGAQGWELVSAFDTNKNQGGTRDVVFIFKRPLG
ncbi:MAG TPA: DUF4177 domain-containing protein [Chthoniobacteraceae bacterium]|jgi:hypothetical protein